MRATTGTAIQQTNCHPFRHGRWLFVHNGVDRGFDEMRRDLMLAIDPSLFAAIQGSTDSEVLFHLALTLRARGRPDRRAGARGRVRGGDRGAHGVENAVQASIGPQRRRAPVGLPLLDRGQVAHAVRARATSRSCAPLHPENPRLQRLRDEDRVVVSEPLADLPGVWDEIPESTVLIVQPGDDEQRPFRPAR